MLVDAVGPDRMVSSLDVSGDTIYVGWCGPVSCDPHPEFASGIDTNVGGEWHRVVRPGIVNGGDPLPNRWISSLRIDPADPLHVYAVYGEYRRPWTAEPRPSGHVFQSTDGGESWTDISGNLPGAPATDLLILGDKLIVSMDVGVFVAEAANPTAWSNLGTGIPKSAVSSLTLTPDSESIVAATYGRGLWTIPDTMMPTHDLRLASSALGILNAWTDIPTSAQETRLPGRLSLYPLSIGRERRMRAEAR
jgi:hypothetical protein